MASHPIKEEPTDTLDVKCIKTASNETDTYSAVPNTSASDACEKKPKSSRKRKKCDSPPWDIEVKVEKKKVKKEKPCDHDSCSKLECYRDVDSEQHQCTFRKIFPRTKEREKFLALRDDLLGYKLPDPKSKKSKPIIFPPGGTKNDNIVWEIIDSLKRNQILKSPLPLGTLNPNKEVVEGYKWKNLVVLPKMERKIRYVVHSALLKEKTYKGKLSKVLDHLNKAVRFEGFTNTWHWFDSYLHGVVTPFSDFHLCLEFVPEIDNCDSRKEPENVHANVLEFLQAHKTWFRDVSGKRSTESAGVKARSLSGNEVFITFPTKFNSSEMKVAKSLLTKFYLDMSKNLKCLSVFVEIILRQFTFNRDYIKNNTDTIFWLVAFFMQLKKLLPPVIDVRKAAKVKHYVDGWDCSLPGSYSYPTEPVSLYGLLLEFFEFYNEFDFLNYVICPYLGRVFRLSDFERLQIPTEEFSLYLRRLNNPDQKTFIRSLINLQDPTDLCCNVNEYQSRNTAHLPNVIKLVCHSFSERLPKSIDEMKTMGCFCKISQNEDFFNYVPRNLTQYTVLIFGTKSLLSMNHRRKLNQTYVLEAIRKVMETIFQFEKKSIVISQSITQKTTKWPGKNCNEEGSFKHTFPVIYFEYVSSEDTWKNDYTKEIIFRKEGENDQIKIYLTCEVRLDSEPHSIRIFIQGDFNFVIFLHEQLIKLLRFTLFEIIILPDGE